MIKFIEVTQQGKGPFSLREVWINEGFVVKVEAAPAYARLLEEGELPSDLNKNHSFSTVTLNEGGLGTTHVVVGAVNVVASKLDSSPGRRLLKG
jgi:hypothetical protein